jgi:hypothetical protein
MAAAKHLRSVVAANAAGETPLTVAEAAESGSRLELLVAMRDRVASAVSDPNCPPRDLAALTRRLQDIAKEIDQLELLGSDGRSVVAGTTDESFDATSV